MRSLGLQDHTDISLAIEPPDFFSESKRHQSMVFFSASGAIEFHRESLDEFAAGLRAAYAAMSGKTESAPAQPQAGAPLAFLSYADEDRSYVERVAAKLRSAGVAVWQDKRNLRSGDRWPQILKQVIDDEADYVVAIQTAAMASRIEGYFYEELLEALERSRKRRPDLRFILPVHTDEANCLPLLSGLHSIPIGSDADVTDLVAAIFEDWRKRPKEAQAAVA